MTLLPRNPGKRPDFKASGPHVKIEKLGSITFTSNYEDPDAPVDEDEDFPKYRYYESQKINGKLFRRVPEREVFEQVKAHAKIPDNEQQSIPIATLWVVIQMKCPSIPWEGYMDWARSVRRE